VLPLLGSDGLLPACRYLDRVAAAQGSRCSGFVTLPGVFWLACSDTLLTGLAYAGAAIALVLALGFANAPLLVVEWFLYMSFCHVGQLFYGYGWEILLLETGFLAIFLCPVFDPRPLPDRVPPPTLVIWLLRWVLFRVMVGAGLIKVRGDQCWRDLTCMMYHYETQPLPNPFSWYLHQLPPAIHTLEVLFNHFVELVVPWLLFGPRRLRHFAGVFLVVFQLSLIISGNLSWLNWLTLTLCIACFDDQALSLVLPKRLAARALALRDRPFSLVRRMVIYALAAVIVYLSIGPVENLIGSRQMMNASFDPLHLVNTYGAFGSIGRRRTEVILEGTSDSAITEETQWREYEFKCKPGDVNRRPCFVAPYHYRIDWQIWFAAMSDYQHNPWLVHFISKLLRGDQGALSLLANNPFPHGPPTFIRAELYEYEFTRRREETRAWWRRRRIAPYLPPVSVDSPALRSLLDRYGWADKRRTED